jgi:phosphopantothenoylcysteine decarboxylase / phosphopantothenate---cysteine ligase
MLKGKKILIGITGGIAAYKICNLVRLFVKEGAEVKIIMTPSAVKFVSPLTLSVLSQNEVVINMFPGNTEWDKEETISAKTYHINYGLWADIFIIAPATANSMAKIAAGISDNFLLSTVLASRCPVLIVPSMDEDMYKNKVTQQNIEKLKAFNYKILNPVEGELASGLYGIGKMPEPETIKKEAESILLKKKDLLNIKVLITAGPTVEPIDKVRFLSNYSSGKMGFEIANAASERGAEVTLITGPVNLSANSDIKRIDVSSSDEMFNSVKKEYKKNNLIIMSSAVADFKSESIFNGKIKKRNKSTFSLNLIKTTDILKYLGVHKKGFFLIGFALETDNDVKNAKSKLVGKNADMIVLNNPNVEGAGFGTDTNVVTFVDKKSVKKFGKMSKSDVANKILDYYISKKSAIK